MKVPHKPDRLMWNHNVHYHPFLLQRVPSGAKRALDIGCGAGLFAARVSERVPEVIAVDRDPHILEVARTAAPVNQVDYIEADIMEAELPLAAFDFVSCIATLHHMPLRGGLERLQSLVAPGGVLVILGLYKLSTPMDYAYAAVTGALDLVLGVVRHRGLPDSRNPTVIVADPRETLPEIRAAAGAILPGAAVRRHMYDRYSLVYSNPRRSPRPL